MFWSSSRLSMNDGRLVDDRVVKSVVARFIVMLAEPNPTGMLKRNASRGFRDEPPLSKIKISYALALIVADPKVILNQLVIVCGYLATLPVSKLGVDIGSYTKNPVTGSPMDRVSPCTVPLSVVTPMKS